MFSITSGYFGHFFKTNFSLLSFLPLLPRTLWPVFATFFKSSINLSQIFLQNESGILFQIYTISFFNSSKFVTFLPSNCAWTTLHIVSIGDKSGELGGQFSMCFISFSFSLAPLLTWQGAYLVEISTDYY